MILNVIIKNNYRYINNAFQIRHRTNFMRDRMVEFFYLTYHEIYARKVAEFIENKNLSFKTYNYSIIEIDENFLKKGYDIHKDIIKEYINMF
jgi:hypothetical protein